MNYWISDFPFDPDHKERAVGQAVLFYSTPKIKEEAVEQSKRFGPFRVLRVRLWALRHGYGWPQVKAY